MNRRGIAIAAVLVASLAGCGSSGSKSGTAATPTTTAGATTTTGPYDNMTGVQAGQKLCSDWTAVRGAYLAAPVAQANSVILKSQLHQEDVAMSQAMVNPPGAVDNAIIVLQTPFSNEADRTGAAKSMDDACAGLK